MLGGLILRSHPTKLLHVLCNSLVGGVEASQWQLLVQELLYINNGTANQRAKNTPSKSAALHEVARECCRVIDTNIMVDVPGDKPQSNSHHDSQQKSHLVLATPLQWIHCLSPFPYYGSWMDPNRMRIDLSQVGGKPRPKRHRPIQTPVPAFLRCTQRAAAQWHDGQDCASHRPQISGLRSPVPFRQEGRIAIVTNAGRDVVDARASARQRSRRAG